MCERFCTWCGSRQQDGPQDSKVLQFHQAPSFETSFLDPIVDGQLHLDPLVTSSIFLPLCFLLFESWVIWILSFIIIIIIFGKSWDGVFQFYSLSRSTLAQSGFNGCNTLFFHHPHYVHSFYIGFFGLLQISTGGRLHKV